jgi:hypothetical protein
MGSPFKTVSLCELVLLTLGTVVGGGCGRPYGVPPFTQLAAEAPGTAAAFHASDEGTVWVVGPARSGPEQRIVYSGGVHRGEWISVDPPKQVLMVDGKPAEVTIANGSSYYQIWFQPVPRNILSP